jgi:uncharacterized protein with transglutaminase domain/transglutaminase superfamily protein
MSRTTLCLLTAAVLTVASLTLMILRIHVMGQELHLPAGPGNYRVTMLVRAKSGGDARIVTACPLDFNRQHIYGEERASNELHSRVVEQKKTGQRELVWSQRVAVPRGPVQARYQFHCTIDVEHASSSMDRLNKKLHAPPRPGEFLSADPGVDPSLIEFTRLAMELTHGLESKFDKARALFEFVADRIRKEPGAGGPGQTALECLQAGRGDALAKSRLLVALCRNRGIPARLVTGLALAKRNEQKAHVWVEAWTGEFWTPVCPYHHFFGRVPSTYLVFGYGDMALVRGRGVRDLDYSCLVEHQSPLKRTATGEGSILQRFFAAISLYYLPPTEWRLVEFLLLLPIAALIICIFRNLIGLQSFGTFAPALIGLAFRSLESLPGILVFVSIVLIGWGLRRVLDRYHLLQVPRTAFLLSLVVIVLIAAILTANYQEMSPTRYISLFPIIILTGMIERFWTLEAEDGTSMSFKTLFGTMIIATSISLILSIPALVLHMVQFPETLGLIMASQLLLGRYTGYRLSELVRFREFLKDSAVGG